MKIKPFTPGEIINVFCKLIIHNKKAKDSLITLSNNLIFVAPELIPSIFWYGTGNCLGFVDILNKHCIETDNIEIKKENEKIKKIYNEILDYYNKNNFD